MSRARWVSVVPALVAWACIGATPAEAGVISRVGGGGTVTLSIFQPNDDGTFTDITDTYLPKWAPPPAALQTVYIVVNGSTAAPVLVTSQPTSESVNPFLADRTTSRFPGNCTNYTVPASNPAALDFEPLAAAGFTIGGKDAYSLTSNDCGGMAVITVGTNPDKYIAPKDADSAGNPTGVPNALNVFGVSLTVAGDPDGDGFSTFDETVRGFIVGGLQLRLNPVVRNFFVYLVKGQCGTSLLTATGGFPVAAAGSLDANLSTLIPTSSPPAGIAANQVHFLGSSLVPSTTAVRTDEWTDHFVSFTLGSRGTVETWTYCTTALSPGGTCPSGSTVVVTGASETPAAPTTDRVVTKNRVYGSADQKGLRITECATTSGTSPHGTGRYGAGAAQGKDEAVVYTDRIRRFVNSLGTKTADIYYSTFPDPATGLWTTLEKKNSASVSTQAARNFITSKIIQYILAMEIGHTLKLLNQALLTSVPTFPHYAAGYGDNMDEAIRAITSGSPAGVKFYIPSIFQADSQAGFQLTGP